MNKITITSSDSFENIISSFEQSLSKVKDIFDKETKHIETINKTDVWTGATQEVIYEKHKELEKNFKPIEESLQIYINFMKKTVSDYKALEEKIDSDAIDNATNLNVNS